VKMNCSRCGRTSVTELRYFKEVLCGRCFSSLFERRVKRSVRFNRLLDKKDAIAIGVSGGVGSMVLLSLFKRIFFKAPHSRLTAIIIDDGMPLSQLKRAVATCKELSVGYHVLKARKDGSIMDKLVAFAKKESADKLALGACLEDEVLDVLSGIMRDSNRAGYSESFGLPVIKPLRECPKAELELYAKIMKIPYSKDLRAGKKEDSFRAELRKLLGEIEERQPGSLFKLLKSTDAYRKTVS
jgi:tRNA(Ile)-lysidine synthase TilS/MesJ